MRDWARSAPSGHAVLAVDFTNAYNTVDRTAMLAAIGEMCPSFLPYANWCYGGATTLKADGFSIASTVGTQQGDVCGPLFFSVTLQKVIEAAERRASRGLCGTLTMA